MYFFNQINLFMMALLTFSASLYGVQEADPGDSLESKLDFGNKSSAINVYIFTDWFCSPCKKWEPSLEEILPRLLTSARVTFVDYAIHPKSRDYIPYDLSFMVNNKDQYFQLRHVLFDLSSNVTVPTEKQISEAVKSLNVDYKKLDDAKVTAGTKYFNELVKKYNVDRAPTIVIVDTKTGKTTIFAGLDKIVPAKVLETVKGQ